MIDTEPAGAEPDKFVHLRVLDEFENHGACLLTIAILLTLLRELYQRADALPRKSIDPANSDDIARVVAFIEAMASADEVLQHATADAIVGHIMAAWDAAGEES